MLSETLHTFVDARPVSYCAVGFFNGVNESGPVSSRLATTRVAPFVATGRPRLEPMALILGLRLTSQFPEFSVVHLIKQSSAPTV